MGDFGRIDWDFARLDSLIQARGEDVIIETGVACPCRNGDQYAALIEREGRPANQRSLSCPQCKGDGFMYRNARQIRGLVTGVRPTSNRSLIDAGFANPGDLRFSPELNAAPITALDKLTLLYPLPVNEGQVLMRGAATLEENQLFVTDLEANEDRLWYEAVCTTWCEDINGVVYAQGADFTFEDHKIQWVGNQPDIGTLYTIKYEAYVEFVSYSDGLARFEQCRNLGQQVVFRKKHVAFMKDKANNSVDTRAEEEIDFTTRTKV